MSDEQRREQRREQIRREFPICTAAADEFRAVFGPEVKILFMQEAGREMGRPSPPGNVVRLDQFVIGGIGDAPRLPPKPGKKPQPQPQKPRRARFEEVWQS